MHNRQPRNDLGAPPRSAHAALGHPHQLTPRHLYLRCLRLGPLLFGVLCSVLCPQCAAGCRGLACRQPRTPRRPLPHQGSARQSHPAQTGSTRLSRR
eukprot:1974737-Rhodomonas_salina.4